jgi:PAS domain S-box-containing protein
MPHASEGEDPEIGIAIGDLQARCLHANRRVADLLGRSPEDLLRASFHELVHPDDAPAVRDAVRTLLDGGAPEVVIERRCLRKNGTTFWGRATLARVDDDQGRPSRILAVIEDLTARQQAESERGRLMSVLEKSLNEIYMFDTASLRFTYVNQGALRNIGYTMEQMRRMTPLDIKPEFTEAEFREVVRPLLEGAQEKHVFHTVHRRSDGSTYPVEVHLQCIAHAGQRRFVAIILDTTERRRAEEALRESRERAESALREAERANRLKDQFLATLSHELRTPLSAILGWTQILRAGARDPADLAKGLDIIERNARAQTKLIEDLLDVSRITSGKLRLEMQRVRPATFVQAALETVRPAAEAKGVRIEKDLDPDAGPVAGDPGRLQQVVWNLLSNAIKFTPSGGRVAVAVRRIDERVEVRVSDTGIGIEPRFLPQLFERFSQADPSTTRRHGGLGLGLSIARHLVELHGGTVHAESDGPGLGATFAIRLPVAGTLPASAEPEAPEAPAVDPAPVPPHSIDLAGVRVLVVDDQPDARALAERLLADCGAEVWSAGSGEDAIAQAVAARPDIVVSDIGMPGMDGYEMLRRIREREGGAIPAVRAIALTAFARPQDAARAREAGFDAHLTKPVDASRLIAAVAALAGRAAAPKRARLAGMPC